MFDAAVASAKELGGTTVHGPGRSTADGRLGHAERLLTLARIWSGVVTDEVRSKDAAAQWVLPRLPEKHRRVLAYARAIYLGDEVERRDDFRLQARAYAEHVSAEFERLRSDPGWVPDA